jgi:hypothetical protein
MYILSLLAFSLIKSVDWEILKSSIKHGAIKANSIQGNLRIQRTTNMASAVTDNGVLISHIQNCSKGDLRGSSFVQSVIGFHI